MDNAGGWQGLLSLSTLWLGEEGLLALWCSNQQ